MDSQLDISIIPVHFSPVQAQNQMHALYSAQPPRHPARGRSADALAFYFPRAGQEPLLEKDNLTLFSHMANLYYQSSGTVTSAARTVIDETNLYLLKRNQQNGAAMDNAARAASASPFSVLVLRHSSLTHPVLTLAQSGTVHILQAAPAGVKHYYDPQRSGYGLGVNKAPMIHYLQFEITPDQFIVIAPSLPTGMDVNSLSAVAGKDLPKIHRLLLSVFSNEKSFISPFILLYFHSGSGVFRCVSPQPDSSALPVTPSVVQPDEEGKTSLEKQVITAKPSASIPSSFNPLKDRTVSEAVLPMDVDSTRREQARAQTEYNPNVNQEVRKPSQIGGRLPGVWAKFVGKMRDRLTPVIERMNAQKSTGATLPSLPAPVMAFFAIAVPILVVTISSMLYLQRGLTSLNQNYYMQAQSRAVQAISEKDPQNRRQYLTQAMSLLDQAEAYQVTDDSKVLRTYLSSTIDEIDGIIRLDFQPVITGRLPGSANIKRIMIVGGDLYLFNATDGNVLRAVQSGSSYDIDPVFYCGPGSKVGPFIDVTALPWDTQAKHPILGMDANGNLMYCSIVGNDELSLMSEKERQESGPTYETLIPPPNIGWHKPSAIALELGRLYVLDPPVNTVWVFDTEEDHFSKPIYIFETKPQIEDAITISVHRDSIYILQQEGRLSLCSYNIVYQQTPTRCENPIVFSDSITEKKIGPQILHPDGTPVTFNTIVYVPPPDPSIYLLEPDTLSVYHLSLRMTLQKQYRAQADLTEGGRQASSFAIGSDRSIFIAVGNNVYGAIIP